MFVHRLLTSIGLLVMVLILFFGIPGVVVVPDLIFIIAAWLLCLLGMYELTRMYKFDMVNQIGLISLVSVLLYTLYFIPYDSSSIIQVIAIMTWCFIVPALLILQPQKISRLVIACFVLLIFVPAFYSIVVLHGLFGSAQLISIIAIAWIADTGAYLVGRKFGRHKLAPHISPGKSIEGALGGFILVLIYLFTLKYFDWAIYLDSYVTVFKFAFILTSVSILGDLLESWFKRVAKVKDSGTILPGHGGMLDRIDSLLAVLPIAFALIRSQI
jgi:phosphatidate cytidylyltransferase